MAEITVRRRGEIGRAVLSILEREADGLSAKEVIGQLRVMLQPTDYELSLYESGVERFDKVVRFNTISLVKAGWLVKEKGTWFATAEGLTAVNTLSDPSDFVHEAVRLYRHWKSSRPDVLDVPEPSEDSNDSAALTIEEAEETAQAEIESFLRSMPPYELQSLVAALLEGMGYHVAWDAPPGPDGGVDLIAYNDPLGTTGPRIKVQVKRYKETSKIGPDTVRSFMAVVGQQDVGIFVTTTTFTAEAEREVRAQDSRRIMLIDIFRFVELWTEHFDALPESARQKFPLRPVYFLSPAE